MPHRPFQLPLCWRLNQFENNISELLLKVGHKPVTWSNAGHSATGNRQRTDLVREAISWKCSNWDNCKSTDYSFAHQSIGVWNKSLQEATSRNNFKNCFNKHWSEKMWAFNYLVLRAHYHTSVRPCILKLKLNWITKGCYLQRSAICSLASNRDEQSLFHADIPKNTCK